MDSTRACVLGIAFFMATLGESFLATPPGRLSSGCHPQLHQVLNRKKLTTSFLQTPRASDNETIADKTSSSDDEEDLLSDVDARVLRSMLMDSKLDLENEADVLKLLERGTVKRVRNQEAPSTSDSAYTSTVIKTLTDTKLWKKLSAQTADLVESLGIWVSNKVEQDVKVLVALGVFGWERAVRDVARALPAAGMAAKKAPLLLSNTTAFREITADEQDETFVEQMNRPSDEIKSVTREIFGILSGQQRSGSGRRLRTAAPAGSKNAAERLRRAYQQNRRVDRQQKDVTRIAGAVAANAYELRRELQAETNKPGYKTEPIRSAIEAGVVGTGNLLKSVKEKARLSAAQRKQERALRQAKTDSIPSFATIEDLVVALTDERNRVTVQLQVCIENPSISWLDQDVIDQSKGVAIFDEAHLRGVVEKMVLLRCEVDQLQERGVDEEAASSLLSSLRFIRQAIDDIYSQATESLSVPVAIKLREQLFGFTSARETPLILLMDRNVNLSQLVPDLLDAVPVEDSNVLYGATKVAELLVEDVAPSMRQVFLDVTPEAVSKSPQEAAWYRTLESNACETDLADAGVMAEVVSDDDFDNAFGGREVPLSRSDDRDSEDEEPNPAIQIGLRSLDVVFFVVEKVVFAGIPQAIIVADTARQRLHAINKNAQGRSGWQPIAKLANPRGRY
jgi:hypothetical protein